MLQPKANSTGRVQYPPSAEGILIAMLSLGLCCSFLYMNSVFLFTLKSKPVFSETSRYLLLYNLLFADTTQMGSNLLLFLLACLRIKMTYFPCTVLVLFSILMVTVSRLSLAVMSLERYVAVCHPLRHSTIFTVRSTGVAIALVWTFSFIHILVRVSILVYLFTKVSVNLNFYDFCSKEAIFFSQIFKDFEDAYASTLFLLVGLIILASYIGVALVARSASKEKNSARKALETLLLHMIQLIFILTSTMFSTIITTVSRTAGRLALMWMYIVCFVSLNILPRCLSALIYGLRDQTIRPVFMKNLCCWWRCSGLLSKRQ